MTLKNHPPNANKSQKATVVGNMADTLQKSEMTKAAKFARRNCGLNLIGNKNGQHALRAQTEGWIIVV